jgi:hypothetical protein
VTLFEELVENSGTASASRPVSWRQSFEIDHPGFEHTLLVHPKLGFGLEATGPVYLAVKLSSKKEVYVDETARFRPSEPDLLESLDPRGPDRREWEAHQWTFTPQSQDPRTVALSILSADIAKVLVRVEDPEKRDGRRAPGY